MRRYLLKGCLFLILALMGPGCGADSPPVVYQGSDWPQWRGLGRDGISPETGLRTTWPSEGPSVLWKASIGDGYSAISIVGDRLYTMDEQDSDCFVVSLDANTGKELWRFKIGPAYQNGQGNGPRSTPTVEGNWVYALSPLGSLVALNATDGKPIWSHDLKEEYGSEIPQWGSSGSPLIEDDLLILDVGGKRDHSVMAFRKKDGVVAWTAHTDKQGYSSPVAETIHHLRHIFVFTGTALVALSPKGEVYWKYPWRTDWYANIATPVFISPDKLFISTSYGVGAAVLKINVDGNHSSFEEVWKNKVSQNHFNSSVLFNGYLYGFDNAILQCVEAATGVEKWKQSGFGKGSLILADSHLIILGERGQLAIAEATPEAYREKSQMEVIKGKTWTAPALSRGKLYLRSQKEILCLDVKDSSNHASVK